MAFNKIRLYHAVLLSALLLSACNETSEQQSEFSHLERASAYQEQGQYKAATIEFKNAVKKSNGNATASIQYADMLNRLGHYDAALKLLNSVTSNKEPEYYFELVETYLGLRKYVSAGDIIKQNLSIENIKTKRLSAGVLLGLGELVKAQAAYQQLFDIDNKDYEAIFGKASVLVRSNKPDLSLKELDAIDPVSEFYAKAQILKAGIQINREQLDLAEGTLSQILSRLTNTDIIEPEKAVTLERMSYVLTRLGRSNEAYIYSKLLSEALPGSSEVKGKYQLAVEKLQANELIAANEILLGIISEYPSYNPAKQLLGVISYLQGDHEAASKYLSDSVDPEVANELTKHIYAATNLRLNDPKKVIEILEPGIQSTEIPETLALYGLAAISDKQYSKGEAALLKVLVIDQDNVQVRLALADFYREKPSPDRGKEWTHLKDAYDLDGENKQILKSIISFHLRDGEIDKAESFIDKAMITHPKSASVNIISGYFALNQNKLSEALVFFKTASSNVDKTSKDYLNALFAKGKVELSMQRIEDAILTFDEVIHSFPDNDLGYKGLLSSYIRLEKEEAGREKLENYAERNANIIPYLVLVQSFVLRQELVLAQEYLERARSVDSSHPSLVELEGSLQYVLAVAALKKGDFSGARAKVAPLLIAQPDNLRMLSFMVDLEIKAGQLTEASKVIRQIENIDDSHPVIVLLKGDLALAQKDFNAAKAHFSTAWKLNPSETTANQLFSVLEILNDTSAQSKHLESWLGLYPDSAAGNLYQAMTYQKRGQRIKAIEGYEKVLAQNPNHVAALNNLGWIYFEKEDKRALDLLKTAVELSPESPAILDSYGWVLAKSGRVEEGVSFLEKANKLAPNVVEISDHLREAKAL